MLYTVIDVGSNSIRMTIFRHENNQLTMLINKKSTAGLASYVSEGVMDELGVQKCCDEVQSFVNLSRNLDSTNISIIATASLRNLVNLDSVQKALENAVGMRAEVLTGQEEARLDYVGVTHHLSQQSGVIVDIGGASTELVKFDSSGIQSLVSLPVGSLSLYNEYPGGTGAGPDSMAFARSACHPVRRRRHSPGFLQNLPGVLRHPQASARGGRRLYLVGE